MQGDRASVIGQWSSANASCIFVIDFVNLSIEFIIVCYPDFMTLLTVSSVSKTIGSDFVLRDISFSQKQFQKIAIAGETGSGKSTLLKIIAGLIQADSGQVFFENEKVKGPAETLVPGHPSIAYLSQHFELPHSLRVEQVLAYANILSHDEANALYNVCQITDLMSRRTDQLSGGERQRIALAKLLIASPKLLLLDEPYSNLDRVHQNTLENIIQDIGRKLKITCILVSHDPVDTLSWANKIFVMKNGRIIQQGTPEKIYRKPINTYVAGLFGKYNLIRSKDTTVLQKVLSLHQNEKDVMIRPENFKIVTAKNKAFRAEVRRIRFFGTHYEVDVKFETLKLILRTATANFKKGDVIYLSANNNEVAYLTSG